MGPPLASWDAAEGGAGGHLIPAFPAQPSHCLGVLRGRTGSNPSFGPPELRPSSTEPWDGVRRPNKRKQMQIKPRKKPWISLDSFGRIGTFQWVTTNPNKKIFPHVTLWPNCYTHLLDGAGQTRARSGNWKT